MDKNLKIELPNNFTEDKLKEICLKYPQYSFLEGLYSKDGRFFIHCINESIAEVKNYYYSVEEDIFYWEELPPENFRFKK